MSIYSSLHQIILAVIYFIFPLWAIQAATLDFGREPLHAGKQLLAEKGYYFTYSLGTAKLAAEAELPVILSYKSTNSEEGMFGIGWRANLFESSLKGNEWLTPWGEIIKLPDESKRFAKVDRMICGLNEYRGWEFLYLFGRLQKIVTPNKRIIEFIYEGPQEKISAVRSRGFDFIRLIYDKAKNPEQIMVNGVWYRIKMRKKQLSSIQCSNLYPVNFKYDKENFLVGIKQNKFSEEISLDDTGRILSDLYYSYSSRGDNAVSLITKSGHETKYFYSDHVLKIISPTFYREFHYQEKTSSDYPGKIRKIIYGNEGKQYAVFIYDPHSNQLVSSTDRIGNQLLIDYNKDGLPVLFHKRAAGQNKSLPLQKIAYNRFGFPEKISTLDQNGSVVISQSIQYDDENQPTEITTEDAVLKLSYNPFGYCASLGGKNGKFSTCYYDEFNRKITEIGSTAKLLRYNNAGLLTQIREISSKDVILFSARLTYDFYGRLARMKDHKGRIVLSEYDPAGFLLKQTYPDNTSVAYQYDSEGNLVQVTDQRGNAIRFEYSANGLKRHITAENQVTEYEYDSQGRKVRMFSYFNEKCDCPDRDIRYLYDEFDRLISTDFGSGYVQNNLYDSWGNLKQIERISPAEKRVAKFDYDHFGRQTGQREEIFSGSMRKDTITRRLEFNTAGQRTLLQINHAGKTREIEYEYNEDGQLAKICSGNDTVVYEYTDGRLTKEIVNDIPIYYDFDEMGRLLSKTLGEYASLKYFYAPNGDLTGREYNGRKILYEYDNLDQVTAVIDAESKQKLEEYVYDPTGNILKKNTHGKISEFRYDKANQLISGKIDEKTFQYRYDAAGRMISDGYSSWQYGWLNSVVKADKTSFSYDVSGQLASAGNEMFLWDNLALIERGDTPILNTPAATGGNPLLTGKSLVFHDMLGSSIGVFEGERFTAFHRTGFGETETGIDIKLDYFTGKPRIPLLGHNFLLRNYNASLGKWMTSDPIGYLDGWNKFLYARNHLTLAFDFRGGLTIYKKSGFPGHVSVQLEDGTYISWNPKLTNFLGLAGSGYNKSDLEYMQQKSTAIIEISGLNENAIKQYLQKTPYRFYGFLSQNCADVVFDILQAGGAEQYLDIDSYKSFLITLPKDVEKYAQDLQLKINSQQKIKSHKKMEKIETTKMQGTDYDIEIPDDAQKIKVKVWDYYDEDGDKVSLFGEGKSCLNVPIRNKPNFVIFEVEPRGIVEIRGVLDGGGGGVTYAAEIWVQRPDPRGTRWDKVASCQNQAPPGTANRYTIITTKEKKITLGGGD